MIKAGCLLFLISNVIIVIVHFQIRCSKTEYETIYRLTDHWQRHLMYQNTTFFEVNYQKIETLSLDII